MKQLFFISLTALASFGVMAQGTVDALRYSYLSPIGTARYSSLGGAMGALGGEFTSIHTNPAALGIYRKTEVTITPSIYGSVSNSVYNSSENEDSKFNFNFGNIGLVATYRSKKATTKGWLTAAFGVGYTRTSSFHDRQLIEGRNTSSSLSDVFVNQANGTHFDDIGSAYPFGTSLAWDTYVIDTASGSTNTYDAVVKNYGQMQKLEKSIRGSMGETILAFGANYSNRIYVGGAFSFPNIRFEQNSITSEQDDMLVDDDFQSLRFEENLRTEGTGVNFKLGVILRASDWVRLGASIHTPTYFEMTDTWNSSMTNSFDNGDVFVSESPQGVYEYELLTPFRATGSVGFVFKKAGLISADYEFVDYSMARLDAPDYSFSSENNDIKSTYKSVGNIRLGTEWRYQIVSFRGGVQFMGDPVAGGLKFDNPLYSAGIGFRSKRMFLDFAYTFRDTDSEAYLYDSELVNAARLNRSEGTALVTVGLRY